MRGMNAATGKALEGADHLRQSVTDILTTPVGSRVMRRDYGSLLFELVDRPWNAVLRLQLFAAVAIALSRWEKRIRLRRVDIVREADGVFTFTLEAERTDLPAPNALTTLTLPLGRAPSGALIPLAA